MNISIQATWNTIECFGMLDILSDVFAQGFSFAAKLIPDVSTLEFAQMLGAVVDLETLLPGSKITTVQALRPRHIQEATRNRYSGHYGFGEFPLHTDIAHWGIPPRYLLLRCIMGTTDVLT